MDIPPPTPKASSFSTASLSTASLYSFSNLRKDQTITIHWSLCLHQEQHQTSATIQIGSQHIAQGIKHLLALQIALQLTTLLQQFAHCEEALTSRLPSAVRNAQFRSFPCQLSIITVINGWARHIWTLIAFPWSNNHTFSFSVINSSGLPHRASCCRIVVSRVVFSIEIRKS